MQLHWVKVRQPNLVCSQDQVRLDSCDERTVELPLNLSKGLLGKVRQHRRLKEPLVRWLGHAYYCHRCKHKHMEKYLPQHTYVHTYIHTYSFITRLPQILSKLFSRRADLLSLSDYPNSCNHKHLLADVCMYVCMYVCTVYVYM